ncbi:MAG: hypothetical protein CVU73_10945 [Deltaproteobacteria bacterium HGW-Deltaproteobacteria-8]|nr:MAG: hypothetical protein CVU73_10945 [Deltaproteobacteria bacterium HGW-Deltaproteobacteria-8]
MVEHLDIFDARRGDLFAEAECRDCEHYLRGCSCQAESLILGEILVALLESNPDATIPGIRIMPNSDDAANRCPGFWPSFEYREELQRSDAEALACWREDTARLSAMGRMASA